MIRPSVFVVLLALLGASTTSAQQTAAPAGQLGVGLNTRGLSVQYAFSESVHAGVLAGINSTTSERTTVTVMGTRPYARVLLNRFVSPFVEVGLDVALVLNDATFSTTSQWSTALVAMVGLEHFAMRELGLYVAVELVNAQLDPEPTATSIGVFNPRGGIEWFFGE